MIDIKSKLTPRLKATDKQERCGFVTVRGRVVELRNTAPDPEDSFRIDPKEVIKWLEKGVVATWHTHPKTDPNLSGEDYSCFLNWPDLKHYIVGHERVMLYVVEDGLVVQE